jgi:hypothetical protein
VHVVEFNCVVLVSQPIYSRAIVQSIIELNIHGKVIGLDCKLNMLVVRVDKNVYCGTL